MFGQSSAAFLDLVRRIPLERWDEPALGVWSVRSLVGHTTRALLTVETYLHADEPGHVSIPTAENYYAAVYSQYSEPEEVAERGVQAGVWLGDDPVSKIAEARMTAIALIEAQHEGRAVSIGGMGIPLDEYLRTRVMELVVHSIDLARATGEEHGQPARCVAAVAVLAAGIAAANGHGEELVLALTGRGAMPEGYSVV